MKKIISLTLATLMIAASFASCAPADQLDPAITLASSDARADAEWLDERLDVIPDDVVLGIGSNKSYGIDMTGFESDGYVLREMNGDVLIFGATSIGLDRAVRKYAKAAEIDQTANLDEVFHEGARIKKLTIGGHDISEYTIVCNNEDFRFAADELQRLITIATGVTVPVSEETASPAFTFKVNNAEELEWTGYIYTVSDSGVVIESPDRYKDRTGYQAVLRFLENELDWFGISARYSDSYLYEADHIDISVGTTATETPVFQELTLNYNLAIGGVVTQKTDRKHNYSYGPIGHACHGMTNNSIAMEFATAGDWNFSNQPCYLDAEFREATVRDVKASIDKQLAAGQRVYCFDISAGDNNYWCTCENCRKIYRAEGSVYSASVVDWANYVAAALDPFPEYTDVELLIFAYCGTNKPPRKLAPHENIRVSFCYNACCDIHPRNAEKCTTDVSRDVHAIVGKSNVYQHTMKNMSSQLEGWLKLTPKVHIWDYHYKDGITSAFYTGNIYEDFKYYRDIGVMGIYWTSYDSGYSTGWVSRHLWSELVWHPDITDEEYEEILDEILQHYYGDGWELVKEYNEIQQEINLVSDCATSWMCGVGISSSYNMEVYDQKYDYLYDLLEEALTLASTREEYIRLAMLSANNVFRGSAASYYRAYEAYDDERCQELIRRYDEMYNRLIDFGVDITMSYGEDTTTYGSAVASNLLDQAWNTVWHVYLHWIGIDELTRPAPEGYGY